MSSNSSAAGGGIGVSGLLGVAFVILKLCGVINWEWIWVLAPFWIPLAFCISAIFFIGVLAVIARILGC